MRRILACLLVLSMMLAFSACQNTKPAGTPDEPSVPAEPVEPVQPDEPAQPTRRNSRLNRMHRKPRRNRPSAASHSRIRRTAIMACSTRA